jgi:hypothetical protein
MRAGIGGLRPGEIEELVDLRRRQLLDYVVRRDLVMQQRQEGLERRAILARLLADDIRPRLMASLCAIKPACVSGSFLPSDMMFSLPRDNGLIAGVHDMF